RSVPVPVARRARCEHAVLRVRLGPARGTASAGAGLRTQTVGRPAASVLGQLARAGAMGRSAVVVGCASAIGPGQPAAGGGPVLADSAAAVDVGCASAAGARLVGSSAAGSLGGAPTACITVGRPAGRAVLGNPGAGPCLVGHPGASRGRWPG